MFLNNRLGAIMFKMLFACLSLVVFFAAIGAPFYSAQACPESKTTQQETTQQQP